MINFDKEIKALPPELQQEVVDFIEFLKSKHQRKTKSKMPPLSAYDVIKDLGIIGCVKGGPSDLSHNKEYMEGYGE